MKKILLASSAVTLFSLTLPAMAFSHAGQDIAYSVNDENFQGYFVSGNANAQGSVL